MRVACANGDTTSGTNCGGVFQIVYDGSSVHGAAQTGLSFDSAKLTDAGNNLQVLSLPAGTGAFWAAYKNGGSLQVSSKIPTGANAADVESALLSLGGLSSHLSPNSVREVDGDTTAFIVPFTGFTSASPADPVGLAGGFSLDFGASLGSLASVQTTGDIIPLAQLIAQATFGINLNPSSSLTVAPSQFQSGPRVDVSTVHQGGHSISATLIRPGTATSGAVQIITINGQGGSFSVNGHSFTWNPSSPTSATTLATTIGAASGTLNDKNAQGAVYTITWAANATAVPLVTVDGTSLTNRNEVQAIDVKNADGGTFALSFGTNALTPSSELAYNASPTGSPATTAFDTLFGSGNYSVDVTSTAGHYVINFQGSNAGKDVGDIAVTDTSKLAGTMTDGNVTNANFSVTVTNQPAVETKISQDAAVTANTVTDGTSTANEVQQLVIKATSGTYTLNFGGQTTAAIAFNANAAAVQAALVALSTIGSGNVAVSPQSLGTAFLITFQGTLGNKNVSQIVATSSVSVPEIENVDLLNATGGTFTLTLDGKTSGKIAYNASPTVDATGNPSVTTQLATVLTGLTYTVTGSAGHWVITFANGAQHVDKFVGDGGGLENSTALATLNVTGFNSTGGTCASTNPNSCAQVVAQQLQLALDGQAVAQGLEPIDHVDATTHAIAVHVTSAGTSGGTPFGGHTAPNDQAFEIDIAAPLTPNTGSTGAFQITETGGTFTLTLKNGSIMATTSALTVGVGASVVQAALGVLLAALNITGTTANVTLSGNTYTVKFNGGGETVDNLSVKVALTGTATIAGKTTAADIAAGLQQAVRQTLAAAGVSYQPTFTVSGGAITYASGQSGFDFMLAFPSPVVAQGGSTGLSLSGPPVQYTFDASQPAVAVSRHVDVSVSSYDDPSFQQLGLSSSPTKLTYASAPTRGIDLNFFVNGKEVPVSVTTADLAGVLTIDQLVTALQTKIDSTIAQAVGAGELPAGTYKITVCRPNIDPKGEPCDHIGNRIQFEAFPDNSNGITSLALDVPAFLADGTVNGAVTELGFQAVSGATQRGKAGTFFLQDVSLSGEAAVAIQNLGLTANLGFLGIAATATGTATNGLLLDLHAIFALKNPMVAKNSPNDADNILDLGVLVQAITAGQFLYDSSKAGTGDGITPPTGFFSGSLQGGFGVALHIAPNGVLAGLGDSLNVELDVSVDSATYWFNTDPTPSFTIPSPTIAFHGPDLNAILAKFQNLSLSSIAQALQLLIQFVQSLTKPGTTIGDLMSQKLPLINQSLSDIINVASSITNEIQAAITSPASAVQQLNNVLAAAFGLPTPSAAVAVQHNGSATDAEVETLVINADGGSFTISFTTTSGTTETTSPIPYSVSAAAAIQTALNKLDGVDVTVSKTGTDTYTITFNHPGQRAPFSTNVSNLARGPPILTWNNGEVDFSFDLKTSIQKAVPFDLSLSDLIGSGGLADIANALIGLGGSGSLTLDASADLHIALGLQLGQHLDIGDGQNLDTGDGQHAVTLTQNATGGTFTLSYNDGTTLHTSAALAWNVSADNLKTALIGLSLSVNSVTCTGSASSAACGSGIYTIDLGGTLTDGQLGQLKADGGSLTGTQQQHISLSNNATGGTFTATYNDGTAHTTAALAYNISADALKTALSGISLTVTSVTCQGGAANVNCASGNYTINLGGTYTRTQLGKISVDGGNLTGSQNAFFLKTGDGADATHLTLTAQATGQNLNFHAMVGPFGLFVKDGSASLGGTISLHLLDGPRGDGHLNLIAFGGSGFQSDLGSIGDYIDTSSVCLNPHSNGSGGTACDNSNFQIATATLPLYVGTDSFQIPINDPILESGTQAFSNKLIVAVIFGIDPLAFSFQFGDGHPGELPWTGFSPQLPSLFALLADPSVVVDGLDAVLQQIENVVQGQIFGVKLPLIGDALADNPVSQAIESIRANLLQPLANLLRQNNAGLDSLVGFIQNELFSVLGPAGINLLQDFNSDGNITKDDIHVALMNDNRQHSCAFGATCSGANDVNIFNAQQIELDMRLGIAKTITLPTINLDLGIPALGLQASFTPQVTLTANLNFGFGVDENNGFYFVTDGGTPTNTSDDHELSLGALVTLSSTSCPSGTVTRASVNGQLLFLALHLTDGTDLNNNGTVTVTCTGGANSHVDPTAIDPQTLEVSSLHLSGYVDIVTPGSAAAARMHQPAGSAASAEGLLGPPGRADAQRPLRQQPRRRRQGCDHRRSGPARRRRRRLQQPRLRLREHPAVDLDEDPGRLRPRLEHRQRLRHLVAAGRLRRHHPRPRLLHLEVRRADPQLDQADPRPARVADRAERLPERADPADLRPRRPHGHRRGHRRVLRPDRRADDQGVPLVRPGALPPRRPRPAGVERGRRQAQLRRHPADGRVHAGERPHPRAGLPRHPESARVDVLQRAAERRPRLRHEHLQPAGSEQPERPGQPRAGAVDGRRRRPRDVGPPGRDRSDEGIRLPVARQAVRHHQSPLWEAGDAGPDQRPDADLQLHVHAGVPDHRAARRDVRGRHRRDHQPQPRLRHAGPERLPRFEEPGRADRRLLLQHARPERRDQAAPGRDADGRGRGRCGHRPRSDQGRRRRRDHGDHQLRVGRPEQGRQGPPRRDEGEHPRERRRPARGVRHHR